MDKTSPLNAPPEEARRQRADGAQSRERLLLAAMRLFAELGFARTSTREIALAAGTNIASISYYFGDKAGLYRAAFQEPAPKPQRDPAVFTRPGITLREALFAFYGMLLAPLKQGDLARLSMRLWYREMLEPTGIWQEEIDNGIMPARAGLTLLLARHMGVDDESDDISRLAFSLVGMAIQLMITRDVIDRLQPHLLDSDAAIDLWTARLVDYAVAIIDAEQARLSLDDAAKKTPPRKKKE